MPRSQARRSGRRNMPVWNDTRYLDVSERLNRFHQSQESITVFGQLAASIIGHRRKRMSDIPVADVRYVGKGDPNQQLRIHHMIPFHGHLREAPKRLHDGASDAAGPRSCPIPAIPWHHLE
jgi:hypothetical protein